MSEDTAIFYKRLGRPTHDFSLERRKQDVLYDKKWKIFLRRAKLFQHIPFVEFVFAAGSMALGNVHENSDLDALIGAKYGHIFTARAFCILAFGILGWRRTKLLHAESAKNKICMHHFVTEKSYRLQPPHNVYWQEVYAHLVPVYGNLGALHAFFVANAAWMNPARGYGDDLRHKYRNPSTLKNFLEWLLGGRAGDWLEKKLKNIQVRRIERGLKTQLGFEPRIQYTDEELEFLPSTSRIHELTKNS